MKKNTHRKLTLKVKILHTAEDKKHSRSKQRTDQYGNMGCGVSNRGYKIRKVFAKESTYLKEIIQF